MEDGHVQSMIILSPTLHQEKKKEEKENEKENGGCTWLVIIYTHECVLSISPPMRRIAKVISHAKTSENNIMLIFYLDEK